MIRRPLVRVLWRLRALTVKRSILCFTDFSPFATGIQRAGVGAMELVAMDMKARGIFVSRMLSFAGCSFATRNCALSPEERDLYDQAAHWWVALHVGFERCIALTLVENSGRSFWGAVRQRQIEL